MARVVRASGNTDPVDAVAKTHTEEAKKCRNSLIKGVTALFFMAVLTGVEPVF